MRLVLPVESGWQRRELDAARTEHVIEGTFDAPEVALVLHHPRPLVTSFREWIEQVVTAGLAPGETVTINDETDVPHELGWRMHVVHALVRRADRPDPVELRLAAFYRFLAYDAAAVVIGRRPERYEERRVDLLARFARGRPEWNGPELRALADFYH